MTSVNAQRVNEETCFLPEGGEQAPRTPCFTEGTVVSTNRGAVPIEDLKAGDLVLTRDNGYRPILWIGSRRFDETELCRFAELQPVAISAGALGPNMPERDIKVSPHHRILLTGAFARKYVNETEVLAPAKELLWMPGFAQDCVSGVTYFHIMFEDHEVIRADGCWTESFLPEAVVVENMSKAQRQEILTIFPELGARDGYDRYAPARTLIEHIGEDAAKAA
ncbi:MAG: Hint domain-containing protein [Rhodobacteraceae bacterium]|nr:Hint domain-containing protein [Paracoccaceae bacterium]